MAKNITKKVLLRLPEQTWRSLKRAAGKENRSMHGQILDILQAATAPNGKTYTSNSGGTGITIPTPETVTV